VFDARSDPGMVSGRGPDHGIHEEMVSSYQYLLKAHIDYLMMTGPLFIFFLLFAHFRLSLRLSLLSL